MNKLIQTLLVAATIALVAGCSSNKAAPMEPAVAPVTTDVEAPVKHHKYHDKLGNTTVKHDTAK